MLDGSSSAGRSFPPNIQASLRIFWPVLESGYRFPGSLDAFEQSPKDHLAELVLLLLWPSE